MAKPNELQLLRDAAGFRIVMTFTNGIAIQGRDFASPAELAPRAAAKPNSRMMPLLSVLLTGQSLANIDSAIANVATPAIRSDLGASGAEVQLVISAYLLAYSVLLITGARLGRIWGYRRLFITGISIFTVASLACGVAPEPVTLIIARIVQGAAAAILVPQVLTGIQLNFTDDTRHRALALFVVALSASAALGQILGGVLISADLAGASWRTVFLINVPIGILLVPAALHWLPADSGGRQARLDLHGVALLSMALLLVLVPLSVGREAGWPAWTWLCLLASAPVAALFIRTERRIAERRGCPLVDPALIFRPEVGWALAARAAACSTYFALLFVIASYLQSGLGKSAEYSGFALVSWVAAFGLGGPLLRRLPAPAARRAAERGHAAMAVAFGAIAIALAAGLTAGWWLIVLLGVGGLGFGLATTAILAHLTSVVTGEAATDVSGLYNTNSQIAAVIGTALFGTVYFTAADHPVRAMAMVAALFTLTALGAALAARKASGAQSKALLSRRHSSAA